MRLVQFNRQQIERALEMLYDTLEVGGLAPELIRDGEPRAEEMLRTLPPFGEFLRSGINPIDLREPDATF